MLIGACNPTACPNHAFRQGHPAEQERGDRRGLQPDHRQRPDGGDPQSLKACKFSFEIYDIFLDDGTLLFESDDVFLHQDKVLIPFESIVAARST